MSLIQLVEEIIQPLLKEIAIVGADGVIKGEPSRKKVKKNKTNSMSGYKKIDFWYCPITPIATKNANS